MSNVIDIADALRKENPDRLFQRVWGRAAIGTSEQCWPVPVKDRYATFKLASIGRRTTTLGSYSICPHCDRPCPLDGASAAVACVACVIGRRELTQ